ncbi:hypothetical protein FHX74_001247 [Friedmanniella endophytica]|uniref:RDD domain-containing protein n=1 Tax=Microlunatus kandeliicorticis TaxID=1759536 RepID=A0A7W3IR00_9ACTN|nr:RDD family protein [Microlunatus kandeliicorticis]MBA8793642.1 hypothetical protein [Microlunatus kandeliicorticis]
MPAALAGAASCLVCGSPDPAVRTPARAADAGSEQDAEHCDRCGSPWWPAAAVDSTTRDGLVTDGPITGVSPAGLGARVAAVLIDLVVPLALATVAVWLLVGGRLAGVAVALAAALVLVAVAVVLLMTGRSPGRVVLGLRTVDDLTGAPLGLPGRRLPGGRTHPLTVDVRHGHDPARGLPSRTGPTTGPVVSPDSPTDVGPDRLLQPVIDVSVPPSRAAEASASLDGPVGRRSAGVVGADDPDDGAAPGVGVVLENGERHDVQRVLFVGRNPVDPNPGPGRGLLALPDLSRRVAKTHLMLEWTGTVLWVTDLESGGGTAIVLPDGSRVPLAPGVRFAAGIGSVLAVGGRTLRVVPGV